MIDLFYLNPDELKSVYIIVGDKIISFELSESSYAMYHTVQ